MRIKDFNILPKCLNGFSFSGTDRIGPISWNELVLVGIENDKIMLKIKEGFDGAGQQVDQRLKLTKNDELIDDQKEKVRQIFMDNVGGTIEEILNLTIA